MPANSQREFQRELEAGLGEVEVRNQRRAPAEICGVNLRPSDYLHRSSHPSIEEAAPRAVRPLAVPPGSAGLGFFLTCGGGVDEIYRLENCLNFRREKTYRTAASA